jgi:hypothetical protein
MLQWTTAILMHTQQEMSLGACTDLQLISIHHLEWDSTHRITIGWPSFHKVLHSIAGDRAVTLMDASTFALIYVWSITNLLGLRKQLKTLDRTGIIQPDIFDARVPRWWPSTPLICCG